MSHGTSLFTLAPLCALLVCACNGGAAGKSEAQVDVQMVGYDLRRLRPRNEEPLREMFQRVFDGGIAEGKTVAVYFSADWCEPCRVLALELGNTHPHDAIGHVRIIELVEEEWEAVTRMNELNALRSRWHPVMSSYPLMVVLDAEGNKVEEMREGKRRLEQLGVEATLPNWFQSLPGRDS